MNIASKTKKKGAVEKALDPQAQTIVSNIESLLAELQQVSGGNDDVDPTKTGKEVVDPDLEVDDAMQGKEVKMIIKGLNDIVKALETTPSDGATANDDAEERIDDPLPEPSQENVEEVSKGIQALAAILGKKSVAVKKSQPSVTERLLAKIVEVQKSTAEQIGDLSEAFEGVFKGLGIADQLRIEVEKEEKERTITKSSNDEVGAFIKGLIEIGKNSGRVQKSETTEEKPNNKAAGSNVVRKGLSDVNVLKGLLS